MLREVLITEFLKLRRSKAVWISWIAYSIMPIVAGLFMWIVREPDRAAQLGLLGAKAEFFGISADWPNYFGMLLQITGIGGMILVSVIAAIVFGREYSDGTSKNMLVLPVQRHWFVLAKFIVVLAWFGALTVSMLVEGVMIASLLELEGYSISVLIGGVSELLLAALVAWLLVPVVAWIAELGRGYLAPLGFTIFALILGNVFGATGWGKWFPWSIVPLFAGVAGPRVETLAAGSILVVILTFVAGSAATIIHLRIADNTQ